MEVNLTTVLLVIVCIYIYVHFTFKYQIIKTITLTTDVTKKKATVGWRKLKIILTINLSAFIVEF